MTTHAAPPGRRPDMPRALRTAVARVEDSPALDRLADRLDRGTAAVGRSPAVDGALRGSWLGHALHPLLTDVPIGMWLGAITLDLAGGRSSRGAATLLTGAGVAAAVPTALTGAADWRHTRGRARRTGVAHGIANGTATLLFGASLVARMRSRHRAGVALGLAGGAAAMAGGYLGGHLSVVHREGYSDPVLDARAR